MAAVREWGAICRPDPDGHAIFGPIGRRASATVNRSHPDRLGSRVSMSAVRANRSESNGLKGKANGGLMSRVQGFRTNRRHVARHRGDN